MIVDRRQRVSPTWLIFALLAAAAGCGRSGPPGLDEAVARSSLTTSLDAWKAGKRPESLKEASPKIIAGDPDWASGARLVNYQVLEQGNSDGSNLHVPVELELEDGAGKRSKQTVVYVVGTSPTITIFPE
jgi:hypothetical protein